MLDCDITRVTSNSIAVDVLHRPPWADRSRPTQSTWDQAICNLAAFLFPLEGFERTGWPCVGCLSSARPGSTSPVWDFRIGPL